MSVTDNLDVESLLLRTLEIDDSTVDYDHIGEYEVFYSISDEAGNIFNFSGIVTIVDLVAPTVVQSQVDNKYIISYTETTHDYLQSLVLSDDYNIAEDLTVTVDDSQVIYGELGTYQVTFDVVDTSGNKTTITSIVEVQDIVAPIITQTSSDAFIEVNGKMDDLLSLVTATDSSGNVSTLDVLVTVVDTIAPEMVQTADLLL